MKFTAAEIELALKLKQLGLPWEPKVGHYVWDEAGIIHCESPFHDSVFYILDLKHFLRRAQTVENLQRDLCWLPTWFDAREILRGLNVSNDLILAHLNETQAFKANTERLCLYQMIEKALISDRELQPSDAR